MINTKEFQRRFARKYIETGNAVQSAIYAGWTRPTALSRSHELVENAGIKKEMERLQAKAEKEHDGLRDKIIEQYSKIAFTNVSDMFTIGSDGKVELIPMADMDKNQLALIANMKSKVKFDSNGIPHHDFEIAMHDKLKALEKLGQTIGLFKDVQETKITSVDFAITKPSSSHDDPENDENPAIPNV